MFVSTSSDRRGSIIHSMSFRNQGSKTIIQSLAKENAIPQNTELPPTRTDSQTSKSPQRNELEKNKNYSSDQMQLLTAKWPGNGLTGQDLQALIKVRSYNFVEMDLRANSLGDEGCKVLAEYLQSTKTLEVLNIGVNYIGDIGFGYLCEGLANNQTLESINLWGNNISDKSLQNLANALSKNKKLLVIDMGLNRIGSNAQLIDKFLQDLENSNQTLKVLNLSGNLIPSAQSSKLDSILLRNQQSRSSEAPPSISLQPQITQNVRLSTFLSENRQEKPPQKKDISFFTNPVLLTNDNEAAYKSFELETPKQKKKSKVPHEGTPLLTVE